ncbi:MAG TPA: aldolase/citrate lyase family protein [Mycobacterium sp.]
MTDDSADPQPPWWPSENRFLAALRNSDTPPTTMWLTLQSPNVVEMAGIHGVDAGIIDLEHTTDGLRDMQVMIMAAERSGMTSLVRVPHVDPHLVGRVLDAGAGGVVFPMVSTAGDAALARESMHYPPEGRRGWAGAHARHVKWCGSELASLGPGLLSPEFTLAADASLASIFMIENPEGVTNVDDILDAGRPHAVIFGWGDFLVHANFDRSQLEAARGRIYDACKQRGIGIALDPAGGDLAYYRGCFVSVGVDAVISSDAIAARMKEVRQHFGPGRVQTDRAPG